MSETNNNAEWHKRHQERLARLASEMGRMFTPGHDVAQTPEYNAEFQEFMWQQHVKAEHDKFDPPDYSDHRFS